MESFHFGEKRLNFKNSCLKEKKNVNRLVDTMSSERNNSCVCVENGKWLRDRNLSDRNWLFSRDRNYFTKKVQEIERSKVFQNSSRDL
jgi:hypothetical protein